MWSATKLSKPFCGADNHSRSQQLESYTFSNGSRSIAWAVSSTYRFCIDIYGNLAARTKLNLDCLVDPDRKVTDPNSDAELGEFFEGMAMSSVRRRRI